MTSSAPAANDTRGDPRERAVPCATYRLQFHAGFRFADATRVVPYLHRLGITHCYCSSYLQAVAGSLHGYDVADPTSLNAEIGTVDDYRAFVEALHAHGLGQILDIVPNHMGIARSCNPWWQDVLENGPASRYARVFDIDWQPVNPALANKVLLPILGDQYGAVLERQEIVLGYRDGAFSIRYFETTLPVAPRSYPRILRHGIDDLIAELGEQHEDVVELLSIITSLDRLPTRTDLDPASITERQREKEVAKRRLAALVNRSAEIRRFVEGNVRTFNGEPGNPASFDLLDELLGEQAYRLAHWRVASEEINYRRFFDINELAAVRTEDPVVFEELHQLVFKLLADGSVDGLRVDHVDGLYDPGDYLRRLQQRARELNAATDARPLYIVVEKILAPDEPLPADWPVAGTTGYEFANEVNGLFVDRMNGRAFDELYRRFTGERTPFAEIVYRQKRLIMQIGMASQVNTLAHRLNRLSETNRHYRDFTLYSLTHAIREIIACFPVYRTYVVAGDAPVSERDRMYIERAVALAKRRNPAATGLAFDFIRDLLLKRAGHIPAAHAEEYARFVTQFQQTTSPVTAKGIEDTALYIYTRLVSLNEVGGEPSRFGVPPAHLHEWLARRQREFPAALSATSTHDTKRGEDVRARINVLSELPGAWKVALAQWSRVNRKRRIVVEGQPAPDRNEEYLLYQTLLGTWPADRIGQPPDRDYVERICAYMVKALREAKRNSSWLNPRPAYEDAVAAFVRAILDPEQGAAFLADFHPLAERVAHAGIWNSLAQTTIKIAGPGVPDFYQGTELWDLNLVDPDNRRPVDYAARCRMLEELTADGEAPPSDERLADLIAGRLDARIKLYTIHRALGTRRKASRLFGEGRYLPVDSAGTRHAHVFAFARVLDDTTPGDGQRVAVAVVPRLTAALVGDPLAAP
ncbi:MAG TPA: malto-oligosyltrehalose synthase, partial [Vicinamibacterales bacterium]|nr:malto-oligosyltrehalose synthase [Vicinamibacterales bacterium]